MLSRSFRALAVGITAALIGLSGPGVATAAPTLSPTSCSGVWVAVQFEDATPVALGCATDHSTGAAMLQSAGFAPTTSTSAYGPSLDQIDAKPALGDPYYWFQASAEIHADGTIGDWVAGSGFGSDAPEPGKVSGFRLTSFSANWPPPGPAISAVPVTAATATPSATATNTASPTPGAVPKASAKADINKASAKAASWLAASVPDKWDSASAALDVGLGLATQECAQASKLKSIRSYLSKQADAYSKTSAYAAAKLAIFASAVGDDPTNFGSVDLSQRILAGAGPNGRLGSTDDFAFGHALAMIGLKRAGTTPTDSQLEYLLGAQLASGAWGFGGSADPDATALALMALSAEVITPNATTKAAVAKASAWALSTQQKAGYWQNFSPVDSTSLLGAALKLHGGDMTKARTWLGSAQLAGGGFANSLTGKSANPLSTATALFLLSNVTFVDVSAPLGTCSEPEAEQLANTGTKFSWPLGLAGVALVGLGGALLLARRDRYSPKHAS